MSIEVYSPRNSAPKTPNTLFKALCNWIINQIREKIYGINENKRDAAYNVLFSQDVTEVMTELQLGSYIWKTEKVFKKLIYCLEILDEQEDNPTIHSIIEKLLTLVQELNTKKFSKPKLQQFFALRDQLPPQRKET